MYFVGGGVSLVSIGITDRLACIVAILDTGSAIHFIGRRLCAVSRRRGCVSGGVSFAPAGISDMRAGIVLPRHTVRN